jgi:hypothetical protein
MVVYRLVKPPALVSQLEGCKIQRGDSFRAASMPGGFHGTSVGTAVDEGCFGLSPKRNARLARQGVAR